MRAANGFLRICAAVVLVAVFGMTALGRPKVAPSSMDILGEYYVKTSALEYGCDTMYSGCEKAKYLDRWVIEDYGDGLVVYIDGWDMEFRANYTNGLLTLHAAGQDDMPYEEWNFLGYAVISGKPGKLKIKGTFSAFSLVEDSFWSWSAWYSYETFSGKQISSLGGLLSVPTRSFVDDIEATDEIDDEGELVTTARTNASFPAVEDIAGIYSFPIKGKFWDEGTGKLISGKLMNEWYISPLESPFVEISFGEGLTQLYGLYMNGVLIYFADPMDSEMMGGTCSGGMVVTGKPGKYSLKGTFFLGESMLDDRPFVLDAKAQAKMLPIPVK